MYVCVTKRTAVCNSTSVSSRCTYSLHVLCVYMYVYVCMYLKRSSAQRTPPQCTLYPYTPHSLTNSSHIHLYLYIYNLNIHTCRYYHSEHSRIHDIHTHQLLTYTRTYIQYINIHTCPGYHHSGHSTIHDRHTHPYMTDTLTHT